MLKLFSKVCAHEGDRETERSRSADRCAQTLTHSLSLSLAHSLTHSLTLSLTHSLLHPYSISLVGLLCLNCATGSSCSTKRTTPSNCNSPPLQTTFDSLQLAPSSPSLSLPSCPASNIHTHTHMRHKQRFWCFVFLLSMMLVGKRAEAGVFLLFVSVCFPPLHPFPFLSLPLSNPSFFCFGCSSVAQYSFFFPPTQRQ